jgi:hypothetical protein
MICLETTRVSNTNKIIFVTVGGSGVDIAVWGTDATADNVSATGLAEPGEDEEG